MFYKMNVTATESEVIDKIELVSPIRESISKTITIDNPTETEITIIRSQFTIANEYIEIQPDTLKIPPKSERGFEIIYRPLIALE